MIDGRMTYSFLKASNGILTTATLQQRFDILSNKMDNKLITFL